MRRFLIVTELGPLVLDEKMENVLSSRVYASDQRAKKFLDASSGIIEIEDANWIKTKLDPDDVLLTDVSLVSSLVAFGVKSEAASSDRLVEMSKKKIPLLISSGLAPSFESAEEMMRSVSLEVSDIRIREMSAKPDLQAMQSVQALDEIDKTANIVSSRLREWYGLHFPELVSMIDENASLIKLVLNFKARENYDQGELEQLGYSKNKSLAIVTAAKASRGADIREVDLARIVQLAEEAQHLFSLRDKLLNHVERTMRQVAPNVSEIAGVTIGARLIARSGGLDKLSTLPASTIQILGAEKALFRALKTGSRPPKHGILFQHAAVHSAPKWQRGRIARAVAGKIAIAARIDRFRGSKDPAIEKSLTTRLDSIKLKYKEAPKERAQEQFVPRMGRDYARGDRMRSPRDFEDQGHFSRRKKQQSVSAYGSKQKKLKRKSR